MPAKASDAPERLERANSLDSLVSWLAWLAQILPHVSWLALVEFEKGAGLKPRLHVYPPASKTPPAALLLAEKSQASHKPITLQATNKRELLALPLPCAKNLSRVLLLRGTPQSPEQTAVTVKLCRWASHSLSQIESGKPARQLKALLSDTAIDAACRYGTPESVALAITHAVKSQWACIRVTLAATCSQFPSGKLSIMAMTGHADVDQRKNLPGSLLAAMQEHLLANQQRPPGMLLEAVGVDASTMNQLGEEFPATFSHWQLTGQRALTILILDPLGSNNLHQTPTAAGRPRAAPLILLLEHEGVDAISKPQLQFMQDALLPCLYYMGELVGSNRRLKMRLIGQFQSLLDWRKLKPLSARRYAFAIASILLLGSCLIQVPLKITARATIEAKDLQVLVAPQAGQVATARVRAGDTVRQGDVLATLDARDLVLSANKWKAESVKNSRAMDHALATRDKVAIGRLRADAKRVNAELSLVERQLERTSLRAPFDGIVLSGDLSQRLGASVSQGDTLFTVASSNEYRLLLDINEQDVGLVAPGQATRVRMSALPGRVWEASVEAVLPVAVNKEQNNVFKVPAELIEQSGALRPGMKGVAKLQVGYRSFAWVYTRTIRDDLRMMLWRIGLIS